MTVAELLSRTQFVAALETEIERAQRDELTMMVMRVRFRPLPGISRDELRMRYDLPDELLDRARQCHEHLRVVAINTEEMMMMVPSLRRRADGEALVATVLDAFGPPLDVDGLPHHLSPMVGAAMLDQEDPSSARLLESARLALGECDNLQPGMMFHPYQRVVHDRRTQLGLDIRGAVLAGEIRAALQPAFDLQSGRLIAVEAFARWENHDHVAVPAGELVRMADEADVTHLLGRQVLAGSLDLLDRIEPQGADGDTDRYVTLWLNVSPDEIAHPEFTETIGEAVEHSPHIEVGLELSPSPPADAHEVHHRLRTLASLGARIAIGDFGIGNANLTMLQDLPFDAVKLDRALIRQIVANRAAADLVGTLVDMARLFNLETTAQGVENQTQLDVVEQLGCDIAQGFFYSEPTADLQTITSWFSDCHRLGGN